MNGTCVDSKVKVLEEFFNNSMSKMWEEYWGYGKRKCHPVTDDIL